MNFLAGWAGVLRQYVLPIGIRVLVKLSVAAQFYVVNRLLPLEAAGWFFSFFAAIQLGSIFTRAGSPVVALEAAGICTVSSAVHRMILLRTLLVGYRRQFYVGLLVGACMGFLCSRLADEPLAVSIMCASLSALWLPAVTLRELLENLFMGSKAATVGLFVTGILPVLALTSCAMLFMAVISMPVLVVIAAVTTCTVVCCAGVIWIAGFGVSSKNKVEFQDIEQTVCGLIEKKSSGLRWPVIINNGVLPNFPQVVAAVAFSGESAAAFAAARALANIVLLPCGIIYPYFVADSREWSSLSNSAERAAFKSAFIKSTFAAIACSAPGFLLVFFAAAYLVEFLLGEESIAATVALHVLTLSAFVNVLSGPGPYALICAGKTDQYRSAVVIGLFVSTAGYLAAPFAGWLSFILLVGAGVSSVNIISTFFSQRLFRDWHESR